MVNPRTHCHFMMQARALRVPELCDDHTPPSSLVTNSLAKPWYRSVNTLTHGSHKEATVTFPACALHLLFVRSCDLAHHGLVLFTCLCPYTHHSSLRHPPFRCLPSLFLSCLTWMNLSACGCLLAPQGGITLITRPIRSQHYILFSSYKLVRAPRPLCSCRPPHDSRMMQRLQVLCPAHSSHSVLPIHRFRWTPPALSQVTFCQLRSVRLPRSSPLLPFPERCIFVNASPPPQLPVTTPTLDAATQTSSHTAAARDASTQLSFREFSAPPSALDVRCPACARPVPSLPLDAAVQTS